MQIEVRKTRWTVDPFLFYRRFVLPDGHASTPSVLLESARTGRDTGRYSIVAKDPFLILRYEGGQLVLEYPRTKKKERRREDPFVCLGRLLRKYSVKPGPGFPAFATGAVGFVGYECKDLLEPSSVGSRSKPRLLPDMYFLFFDKSVVWDHQEKRLFLCALSGSGNKAPSWRSFEREVRRAQRSAKKAVQEKERTSHHQKTMKLESSFNAAGFERAVRRAQRYIRQGEIFQANLSQRFSFEWDQKPEEVYARLRKINPSPFFGVFDAKEFQIISGSPERLLKLEGRQLETRPIAGTRMRGKSAKEDRRLALDLLLSEKERAEHIMLVDLERNDLGRVSEYGSVRVDELMALEDYSHVKHIVSNVRGALRKGLGGLDAFRALFPGGTITGAPKIRCMQILDELEPVARGAYTGSLGYFSFTGNMDFNILIRSLALRDGRAYLHVGAGIVADSQPRKEYHETLYKAEAVLSAVFGEKQVRSFFRRSGVGARSS